MPSARSACVWSVLASSTRISVLTPCFIVITVTVHHGYDLRKRIAVGVSRAYREVMSRAPKPQVSDLSKAISTEEADQREARFQEARAALLSAEAVEKVVAMVTSASPQVRERLIEAMKH